MNDQVARFRASAAISADFGDPWLRPFAENVLDFEEFMATPFELGTVEVQTVRP